MRLSDHSEESRDAVLQSLSVCFNKKETTEAEQKLRTEVNLMTELLGRLVDFSYT